MLLSRRLNPFTVLHGTDPPCLFIPSPLRILVGSVKSVFLHLRLLEAVILGVYAVQNSGTVKHIDYHFR